MEDLPPIEVKVSPEVLLPSSTLLFFGEIEDNDYSFCGKLWQAHLYLNQEGTDGTPIKILLSSSGGDYFVARSICSVIREIRRSGRDVEVHVGHLAGSAAIDIMLEASKRTAYQDSVFLIHQLSYPEGVSEAEKELYTRIDVERLAARLNKQKAFLKRKIKNGGDWWLDAKQALEIGLIDAILD